jgi:Domain of unknown function (DUF4349)
MKQVPKSVRFLVAGLLVLLVLAGGGRFLLRTPATSSPSRGAATIGAYHAAAAPSLGPVNTSKSAASAPLATSNSAQSAASPSSPSASGAPSASGSSAASGSTASAAVTPVGPQIVRTATVSLKVGKGNVPTTMSRIADLAATDGGYVQNSSMSVGSSQNAASSGAMVIEVDSGDLNSALADLSFLGKVTAEQTAGQDVTSQVAENAATLDVLQQEVNVLDAQLSKATNVSDILQIQGQLFPVAQQLQQLQSQQSALESSAELAAVTVNLNAPAVPITPSERTRPGTDAAVDAWHYLRHNTLAVLDGIAVAGGWVLPLGVLGGLVWFVVFRIVRRRRPGVTPA